MGIERHRVAIMADGADFAVTVHEIAGAAAGPTVGICGSIHGDETVSSKIVMDVAKAVAGQVKSGRLLLLPVADPLGFAVRERETPHDSLNLNRVFPGSAEGWLTEKLAAVITEHFLSRIDVLIDLHAGGGSQTVDYVYILNDEALSRSFGSRILYKRREGLSGTYFTGTSSGVAGDRGIRAVTVELGGGLVDQRPYVQRGVAGVLNMLRTLSVIDGSPAAPRPQVTVERIVMVRPSQGGWLVTEAPELGAEIAGGAILGRVVSPYTFEELEVIRNPVERGIMILSHLTTDVVHPGAYGYMVGDLAPDPSKQERKACT